MNTFILCINYRGPRPDLGTKLDEREDKASKLLKAAGGELVNFYRIQGRFDVLAIVEMPDAETMHAFNLAMQDEHFTVETMRGFTPEEYPAVWEKAGRIWKESGVEE